MDNFYMTGMDVVREKISGKNLDEPKFEKILQEIISEDLGEIERLVKAASFLTACQTRGLDLYELNSWVRAMVNVGEKIHWGPDYFDQKILDKHCVGGVPGNRTTPIIASIIAANGLLMPKSSSRAITSPSGTADMMDVLTNVKLNINQIRKVLDQEGACLVWGGNMGLAPADQFLIQVEKILNLNFLEQIVVSIMAKKIAFGSSHIVIDLPIGPDIKINSEMKAQEISRLLKSIAAVMGVHLLIKTSDGSRPIGSGIGPCLEARDVLRILKQEKDLNKNLEKKALEFSGYLLEFAGACAPGMGFGLAQNTLNSGMAWAKFQKICEAQGGLKSPGLAVYQHTVRAKDFKDLKNINLNCAVISRLAKIVGAPINKEAGVDLHIEIGRFEKIEKDQEILTLHSNSKELLDQGLAYLMSQDWVTRKL